MPGAQGATSTLTVTVPAGAMVLAPTSRGPRFLSDWKFDWKIIAATRSRLALASLLASILLMLLISMSSQRKLRPRYAWLAATLLFALVQTSCGGGSSGGGTTPPPEGGSQTFTVTVTGTSTTGGSVAIQHAATITVTVP
jgi:hypothetical protein